MDEVQSTEGSVLPRLRAALPALIPSDVRVAREILANPEAVIHLSDGEVAAAAGTSASTVVRCCQRLGFRGFQHLKIALAQDGVGNQALERSTAKKGSPQRCHLHSLAMRGSELLEEFFLAWMRSYQKLDVRRWIKPEIPPPTFEADDRNPVQLIADTLEASPEPITLIPVGPLTNIALFLREHSKLKAKISHVSLVGGSIGLGNTTPAAEFNIYVDPEAAREVFESGLPITMSGLDVTHQAGAGPEEREKLHSIGEVSGVVAGFLEFFAETYESVFGFDAPPLHDPVAVAAVLQPELLMTRPMHVDVECESDLTRGETVCDFHGVKGFSANAEVGVELNREGFFELLYESLGQLR